jgi:hypothetical protein
MKTDTLTILRHSDPLARAALLGLIAVVAWLNIVQPNTPSLSTQAPIIVLATLALHEQLAVPPASLRKLAPSAAQWTRQTPEAQRGVALAAPMIAPLHLVEHQPTAPPPAAVSLPVSIPTVRVVAPALPAPPQVLSRAKTPVLRVRARLMSGWIDDA